MVRMTSVTAGLLLPAGMAAGIVMIVPAAAAAQASPPPAQCAEQAASARTDHAISTKGTGTSGRAEGGADCDDLDDDCDARGGPHVRYDPLILDLRGDGVSRVASAGTGATDAAPGETEGLTGQDAQAAIGSKGPIRVSASQSGQTLRHAINTKGTGVAGRTEPATDAAGK